MSRSRAARRRRTALLCAAALAAVAGAVVGAAEPEAPRERPSVGPIAPTDGRSPVATDEPGALEGERAPEEREPIVRVAGKTIVMRFAGTRVPAYVLRALRERRAAGVILFRDNVVSSAQVKRMTSAIADASNGRAAIMVDQEGGEIRILRFAPPQTAPPSLRTVEAAGAQGRAAARALREHGFTVNLAPVADVAVSAGSVMRTRAFPGSGAAHARLVAASVRAHDKALVLPTLKHFPGLGRSRTNTDFEAATVPGRGELEGFRAGIAAGAPLVMSSHALYPDLDPRRIASQSRRILVDLLREQLGFRGVVITDSLEAQAVVRRTSTPVAAVRSMAAGNDLLLTTGKGSYLRVLRALVAKARRDPAFRARLRVAEGRVAGLARAR